MVVPSAGSGRCCHAATADCAPSGGATSVTGESLGVRPGFSKRGFLPSLRWRNHPFARQAVPGPPRVFDARTAFANSQKARAMQLTGAEIVIRCLQEEGVEYVFGYPGGAVLNIYDELFKQDKVKHVLVRHEQGAVHAADGYSRSSHKVGVALVTSGPGRHQRGDRHRDRVHGFDPDGGASPGRCRRTRSARTRSRNATPSASRGRASSTTSWSRTSNDLAVTIKKAFYLAATGRPGPGAGRHPEGRHAGDDRVRLSEDGLDALVQPGDQGPRRADQEGGAAAARREAADGLRRRRRDPQQRGAAADAARAPARLPVHEHADGARRLSRHRSAVHRHARHARHVRVEHGDAALRRADRHRRALRRPRDRQSGALLPQPTARSSTSTSTRRRSRSASRSTCRSSATSPTCWTRCSS